MKDYFSRSPDTSRCLLQVYDGAKADLIVHSVTGRLCPHAAVAYLESGDKKSCLCHKIMFDKWEYLLSVNILTAQRHEETPECQFWIECKTRLCD